MSINLSDLNLSREDKLSLLEQLKDDLRTSKNNLRTEQKICIAGYDEIIEHCCDRSNNNRDNIIIGTNQQPSKTWNCIWYGGTGIDITGYQNIQIVQDNQTDIFRGLLDDYYHPNDRYMYLKTNLNRVSFRPSMTIYE